MTVIAVPRRSAFLRTFCAPCDSMLDYEPADIVRLLAASERGAVVPFAAIICPTCNKRVRLPHE